MHSFQLTDASLIRSRPSGAMVSESMGFLEVCVQLNDAPPNEVNVTLRTDDTQFGAQGKLFSYVHRYIGSLSGDERCLESVII